MLVMQRRAYVENVVRGGRDQARADGHHVHAVHLQNSKRMRAEVGEAGDSDPW